MWIDVLQTVVLAITTSVLVWQVKVQYSAQRIRAFEQRESELNKTASYQIDFIDPEKTSIYEEFPSSRYAQYCEFARACWDLAEDIFLEKRIRKLLVKKFAPFFERVFSLHYYWFNNNTVTYEPTGFAQFVDTNKWKEYLDPQVADALTWTYEVYKYDQTVFSPMQPQMFDRFKKEFIDKIIEFRPKTVADLGCGNGRLAIYLVENCPSIEKICAIDYSDTMLHYTEQQKQEINNNKIKEKIETHRLKIQDLHLFSRDHFDTVIAVDSILPRDPEQYEPMFEEIKRVLKPGGKFFGILPSFDSVLNLRDFERTKLERNMIHKKFYELGKLDEKRKIYANDFRNTQRLTSDQDARAIFSEENGFICESLTHFTYPWEFCERFKAGPYYMFGYYPNEKEMIYDLLIIAEKRNMPNADNSYKVK